MKKRLLTAWIIACMFICLVGQTPITALADGDDTRVISVPEGLQELLVNEAPEIQAEDTIEVINDVQNEAANETGEVQSENENEPIEQGEAAVDTNETQNENTSNTVEETPADIQPVLNGNIAAEAPECIEQTVDALLPQGTHNYGDIVRVSGLLPKDAIVEAIPVNVEIEGQSVLLAYDITIYENEEKKNAGISWQPDENGLSVEFISTALEETEEEVNIWHMEDVEESPEYVTAAPSIDGSVEFVAESFSVYVVTETKLTATIVASDGNTYEINVTYDNKSGIPMDGTALKVDELKPGDDGYDEYIEESASKVGAKAEDLEFSKVFDIKIVDENDENTVYEPTGNVDVSIRVVGVSFNEFENVNVLHFVEDKNDENVLIYDVDSTVKEEIVEFSTDSFSVYVIVASPSPYVVNTLKTVKDLAEFVANNTDPNSSNYNHPNYEDPEGFFLSYGDHIYILNTIKNNNVFNENSNINSASRWYFEAVSGQTNQYFIYTKINNANQYMYNTSGNNMGLTSDNSTATAFELQYAEENKFCIKKVGEDKWLQHSGSGGGIRLWTDHNNATNSNITFSYASSLSVPYDYYNLNGKSYGLMYYDETTTAYAMMATEKDSWLAASEKMLVRHDPMQQNDLLFVAKDKDISFWTFECIQADKYHLISEDNKYLKIESNSVSLSDTIDDYCLIQVVPKGDGIKLIGVESNREINYNSGFKSSSLSNASGQKYILYLAERSVYSEGDFVSRFAYKVSVSDTTNVHSGTNVIIYTRIWNETDTKYEFYAIDHNGDLVPCYESGDTITWIGLQNNTLLWEITDLPNGYYQLQNTYNQKYLAPQITGEVFTTDENVLSNRINLGGRSHGDYYTTILRWDDPHYDYACIRHDNSKIISGRMAQAEQFYFAVMDPLNYNGNLTEVETVDHTELKMTMKMVNFSGNMIGGGGNTSPTTQVQYDIMGTYSYTEKTAQPGLLSNYLVHINGDDGYPEAAGGSLKELFSPDNNNNDIVEIGEVNNLFIKSIYESSGYFQFDSTQNFAHLNTATNKFEVFQELGTVDGQRDTRRHGQFMPFNTIDTSHPHDQNPENLTNILAKSLDESDPRKYETLYGFNEPEDHYFGMEISGSFMQTPNGLDAWGHDLIFDFVGDDDFWLYVDDELVIDLGGIHGALAGSVNYRTGKVVVNGNNTTLYNLFRSNYIARNPSASENEVTEYLNSIFQQKAVGSETCYVFKDYSTHTVRIFYMERGAGASNLRMRFNLATVTPGEVTLRKEVTSDNEEVKDEYSSIKYPFQILYKTPGTNHQYTTWGSTPEQQASVKIKNTSNLVDYISTFSVGGYNYSDVFFLRPGQDVTIQFPDDLDDYYIRECGIDNTVYNRVSVNGEIATETPLSTISDCGLGINTDTNHTPEEKYKCFETSATQVKDRAEVVFSNNVIQNKLHTLTITKKLFDEQGYELDKDDDSTGFLVRIYLGGEDENSVDKYYDTGEYCVIDDQGNYCKYNGGFVPLGNDFNSLSSEDKISATFHTSPSGAADKIPAGYSIVIRDLLEGTYFKVVEEDHDIPLGYGKKDQCYYRKDDSYVYYGTENVGVIGVQDAKMEVHNVRGYGIQVNKVWSDSDFISEHGSIKVAVYVNGVLLPETIREIGGYNTTRYFFETLQPGATFDDYEVFEVEENQGNIIKKDNGDSITVNGNILKHQDGNTSVSIEKEYSVSYEKGQKTTSAGSTIPNIRTDTITNIADGGLKVLIKDTNGNALTGGQFELRNNSTNKLIDTYTADSNGLITTLYLDVGNYTLTETKTPIGYQALKAVINISVENVNNNKVYNVENGVNTGSGYEYNGSDTLTIINQKYTLKAIKVSSDTASTPLAGAHFALYKQITVNGNVRKDYYPIPNFDNLVSGSNGVIQDIDENHLSPGTYYLVETEAPPGYSVLAKDVILTIDPTNPNAAVIAIDEMHQDLGWLEVDSDNNFTLKIPNPPDDQDIVIAPTNYTTNYKPFFMMFGFGAILVGLIVVPVMMLRRRKEEEE
ncbi:MAG: hypothetical protein J6X97_06425 [Lachnospiraceae bacterium]|nr:hypothetical protein [Lachnospiraceae bacterium]